MQYHQRQAFQADSDDEEDAVMNAPGPNNPDTRYADDGLDGLDAEEAEQERLLSERFGEAGEAPSEKRKTAAAAATDQDIAAELAGEVRRAKKSRPTLQPTDLTGPANGLNRIKNEFNDLAKYRSGVDRARLKARKGQRLTRDQLRRAELNAAAAYSRDLVGAYRNYCRDLFPALAFEDTVARIETLGSKKEVKDYVEIMREDVRRQHLVKIYGAGKTDRMLAELESNLVGGGADGFGGAGADADGQAAAVANPYGSAATNNVPLVEEEEDDEEEVPPASPARDYRGVTRFSQRANPYATTVDASSEPTPADKDVEEEEEEVEASFDEEDVAPTGDDVAVKEAGSAAETEPSAPDVIPEAEEADEQDQNNDKAQENDEEDEEEELEFVDAPKEKEAAEEEVAAAKSSQQDNDDGDIEEDADDEQLFFDGTQPSQATDASPAQLEFLGQETPSPQSTPEGGTPPSSEEKGGAAPAREEQEVEEPDTELPETEAFGMPSDVAMEMMEDVPTQHVAHDDGEEVGSQELVMDATQETLTNVLPTMTAPDAEDGGDPMSQMSLEY